MPQFLLSGNNTTFELTDGRIIVRKPNERGSLVFSIAATNDLRNLLNRDAAPAPVVPPYPWLGAEAE